MDSSEYIKALEEINRLENSIGKGTRAQVEVTDIKQKGLGSDMFGGVTGATTIDSTRNSRSNEKR